MWVVAIWLGVLVLCVTSLAVIGAVDWTRNRARRDTRSDRKETRQLSKD